ncbi:MAG TPA: ABC transporter ATP-binding protein [Rubrobacteraceae bacterium]|nr:ABC transporter ATP-binding protein [Rubrobacteraceae bacterium]
MTGETMIRLRGVSKSFGAVEAVRDLDLELTRGKILALLGPSGCGKTTTLRLLAGFESPDAGEIEIAGHTVAGGKASIAPEKRRVGMVFQDYALFSHLTVAKNVAYGLKGIFGAKKREARVAEILGLARLDGLEDRMPHELSGGQQQRVALARALAPEPAVVLLDEPFSNLDAALRAQMRSEMREILKAAGATAVFVTHDQAEALSFADEVAVMFDGTIVQAAPPEDLYHRPATREVAEFVGEANFMLGTAEDGRLRCALGDVPACGECAGNVEAMLRPEALHLRAPVNGEDDGVGATVIAREFYGHDQLVKLRLDSGPILCSRLGGGPGFKPGERVLVETRGTAVVFPKV